MWAEVAAAIVVALVMLWLIFQPLVNPTGVREEWVEPEEPDETPRGVALLALKELDLDRATGKLSDEDYEMLKARYAAEALQALREEETLVGDDDIEALISQRREGAVPSGAPICSACGPRPEADAVFCSSCGVVLVKEGRCTLCGTEIVGSQRFCGGCGNALRKSELIPN